VSGANRINGVHLYSMRFAPLTDILQPDIFLYDEFWFRFGRVREYKATFAYSPEENRIFFFPALASQGWLMQSTQDIYNVREEYRQMPTKVGSRIIKQNRAPRGVPL